MNNLNIINRSKEGRYSFSRKWMKLSKDSRYWGTRFLENCERKNRSQHTLKSYENDLLRFLIWWNAAYSKKIIRCRSKHLDSYLILMPKGRPKVKYQRLPWTIWLVKKQKVSWEGQALGLNSQKRNISTLKKFFDFCYQSTQDNWLSKLPHNPIRSEIHSVQLKQKDIASIQSLTPQEWGLLDDKIYRPRERLLIHLLYYAGLRIQECARLSWDDISSERRSLHLLRKGGKKHELFPHHWSLLHEHLIKWQRHCPSSYWVFPGHSGQLSTRALQTLIKKCFLRAGIERNLSAHSFRKGCATQVYLKTKDLMYTRDYLNHSDAQVTQTYIDTKLLASLGKSYA